MKLQLLGTMLVLSLFYCGRPPVRDLDPELKEYVSRFEALGGLPASDLKAHFGSALSNHHVGECTYQNKNNIPEVTIDEPFWRAAGELQREELMFHELGHCLLKRQHKNTLGPDYCPSSIMYYQVNTVWCLKKHRDEYLKEIFLQ